MERKGWTAEELAVLKEYYPKEGIGVKERLKGRTENQIYGAAWHYGIKNSSRKKRDKNIYPMRRYTEEDITFIQENIQDKSIEEIAGHLGRTPNALRSAISKKGIGASAKGSPTPWTEKEKQILKDYFKGEGIAVEKRLEGRSRAAIYSEADHLGLAKGKRTKRSSNSKWTKEEDNIILEHYIKEGADVCCSLLKGRSRQAVIVRANRYLGIRKNKRNGE